MIEVQSLSKSYGNFLAVNNISFKVDSGEILGILGPNGAGKTTTLKMITGFVEPSQGKVLVEGIDLSRDPIQAKSKMSYLGEVPPLYPDMTVKDYLKFVADLRGLNAADEVSEVKRVIELLHLEAVESQTIEYLSKGFKQRVGIAQALIGHPKVVVLDEPTVGLDPLQMLEMRQILVGLKRDHTVLFSSHLLSEVQALCDRVVIIQHGQMKALLTREQWMSRGLQGSRHIVIQTVMPLNEIDNKLLSDPCISRIKILASHLVEVTLTGTLSQQADYLSNLISRGIQIAEFKIGEESLESLFVQLTSENFA